MRACRTPSGLRTVALGLALVLLGSAVGAERVGAETVVELIERLRVGGREGEQAVRELSELGPEAASEILGLSSGRIPDLGPLTGEERDVLMALLRSWPADQAVEALVQGLPSESTLDDRLMALELVGQVGGRAAVTACADLCSGLTYEELNHPLLTRAVEGALEKALRSDESSFDQLGRLLEEEQTPDHLALRAAAALGAVRLGRGLPILERMLGRRLDLDGIVLGAIGDLRPFDEADALLWATRALRSYLTSVHPELRRRAALSLGALGEGESVPDLIALLEDRDRRVSRAAEKALGRISGLASSLEPAVWSGWYESELLWWETEGGPLLEELPSADPIRVVACLRILSMHPVHREAMVDEIQALLEHDEVLVVSAACAALAKLDDVTAFEPLLAILDDERTAFHAAAHQSLTALTGAVVEPHKEAWQAWLGPARP